MHLSYHKPFVSICLPLLFAAECAAHRLLAIGRTWSCDTDLRSAAFTVVIIHTFTCLAVYIDRLAATAAGTGSCHTLTFSLLKASTACLVWCIGCIAGHLDIPFGTQFLFVVDTCDR